MKIGIKIYPDKVEYIKKIIDHVDFIEVMAIVGEDFSGMNDYDIPYVIHNQHFKWGINLANPKSKKLNMESINQSIKLADDFNAKTIVVHPGILEDEGCSITEAISNLKTINDSRIAVENVPFETQKKGIFYKNFGNTVDKIHTIMKEARTGFCLDFSHAKCEAVMLGEDYMHFIKRLNNLNPAHYHICDGIKDNTKDMHKHFGEGNMDLDSIKKLIPNNARVTIETWQDLDKQIKEINFLRH